MKIYDCDLSIRDKVISNSCKGSYKWKSKKRVRLFLLIGLPIISFTLGYLFMGPLDALEDKILTTLFLLLFGLIPYIIYYKHLYVSCIPIREDVSNEKVMIGNGSISYVYHPNDVEDELIYDEFNIDVDDIDRIVYKENIGLIEIHGRVRDRRYTDIINWKYKRNKYYKDIPIKFLLYFEDKEKLLDDLRHLRVIFECM